LQYLLKTQVEALNSFATGTTFTAVSAPQVGQLYVSFPPFLEQCRISAYLNEQTAKIDRLMDMRRRQMALLKEQRAALIQEAVTRGLNPNAPMKDSGLPWLGEIPAHWSVIKLKYLARFKSGESITSDDIDDSGTYPVFGGNGIRGFTQTFTHEGHHVLIGRQGALCGNVNYATGKFWASEHAVVTTLMTGNEVIWFGEMLRFMNLNQYSQSAAQPGLAVEKIQNLLAPVPPNIEQIQITQFIEIESLRIERLQAAYTRQLALLTEYRAALIHECITGQCSVPETSIA
jgi:type I restriction enzyme S subunit